MRIDPNLAISPAATDPQKAPAKAVPQGESAPPSSGSSIVALSPAAAQAVSEPQPNITARIERIRALLERGAYPIDLDVLATRIVDDEMLRAGRPS